MSTNPKKPRTLNELKRYDWPLTTNFRARLGALRCIVQKQIDRLPNDHVHIPRTPALVKLSLDDLILVLTPAEKRLLDHLQARRPLKALLGQPGFRSVRRRNQVLQRLLSKIQRYVGSSARHALMRGYDTVGHDHRHRRGPRRRLLPPSRLPLLEVYIPHAYVSVKHPGLKVLGVRDARLAA